MRWLIILFSILVSTMISAQEKPFSWIEPTETSRTDDRTVLARSMAISDAGDIYVAGLNGNFSSSGELNAPCLAKYSSDGQVKWVEYFGGMGTSWPVAYKHLSLNFDNASNLIGIYGGYKLNFDGTPRPLDENTVVVKFDTTGSVDWVSGFHLNSTWITDQVIMPNNDIVLLFSGGLVRYDGAYLDEKKDIIMVLDGETGEIEVLDYASYTDLGTVFGASSIHLSKDDEIVSINSRTDTTGYKSTYITQIDYLSNTVTSESSVGRVFYDIFESNQYGNMERVWSYDDETNIAYLTGFAQEAGMPIGASIIYGTDGISPFLAKVNLSSGQLLSRVVFHNHGDYRPIYHVGINKDQLSLFVMYEDSITNQSIGYTTYKIEEIPTGVYLKHNLIENYDLDLNLNYHNKAALPVTLYACYDADYGVEDDLTMLYAGGQKAFFNHNEVSSAENTLLANIGDWPMTVEPEDEAAGPIVYPVPALNRITVESDIAIESMTLLNLAGQTLLERKAISESRESIDVEGLPTGLYLIQIVTKHGLTTKRLLVQ